MVEIGKTNRLHVIKEVTFGVYLDAGELGEILLPARYVPRHCRAGDTLQVFVYFDSDDTLIATTLKPKTQVGECAYLCVVAVNRVGAFLDWGLTKDLLVPFNQQRVPMQVGRSYVVYTYVDEPTQLIAASTKLSHYLSETSDNFRPGQSVELLICARTDLGLKAVVDGTHLGMIFKNDVLQSAKVGRRMRGYVKSIRPDGKIDLTLQAHGRKGRDELCTRILNHLKTVGGESTLTDKSTPEAIYKQFGVSKANYKKALGRLYKERAIALEKTKISLL